MNEVETTDRLNIPEPEDDFRPLRGTFLREERLPHIWCSTCGIGVVITAFISGLQKSGLESEKVCVVSGIGCSGRAAGYLRLDSFHTTHGRAIPFATGLALGNPKLKVVVISGDGDIAAIGGNHLIHAARRNMDLTVICINNFIYAMTGGQAGPTTPIEANASTTPFGCYEHPFNLPFLAESSGAVYVARWTALHVRRLSDSISEALCKPGFSFVEVISPCPTAYARRNKLGTGLDLMKFYQESAIIDNGADTSGIDIDFGTPITVGKFVDKDKPSFIAYRNQILKKKLGDRFLPYRGPDNGH
ncbi:MAG: 2-oxoacid:ferredoxin oxidoreductase subunit beta [Deltaproteobacteria bacterium]|jgi:2-oxoglutarate/2-oxoacid ferredoxin oxidoreductase subunit beta|nr:2-oxoacid:ferredoxin oxidoreductase subunit beta [Deltaproteobacteria bacterium]MBT4090972.1 2-oxoacid:ferredoxin oxidoreductase subunit beta [Deltaproteobacteria bacterium]MBT4267569.1 2-oxoacid:ferredoxin oxidoreductase subunit beta [Deltaproteobacteria bacterium]MBT4642350.1 2-oxoacid:ferredoxin oxidoreductase subunit beta [Deltaproteobacteria bacterium]MBT6502461.1 2-oxoacid:ferredoxin oxidoreductase subunit beta [Deltaproteobacteria bacterium]